MMKRSEVIDVAKGIGILSVVWAHAKGPFSSHIYQFHMPLFFLLSGYLYSSRKPIKAYVIGKIRTLYLPFAAWNVIFTLMKAVLKLQAFSLRGLTKEIAKILLTLSKDGQFLGATWFLGALFVVSIAYRLLDEYLPQHKEKPLMLCCIFGVAAVIGFEITLPAMVSRTLILSSFFAIGAAVKVYHEWLKAYDLPIIALTSLAAFFVIGKYNSANMGKNQYTSPICFVIGALMASYCVVYASAWIAERLPAIKRFFAMLGRESLSIVIWQFVVFRLVIAVQLLLEHKQLSTILDYYPCYKTSGGWWIVYTIVGVFASILLGKVISVLGQKALGLVRGCPKKRPS